jgi:hypothetical protein
VTRLRPELLRFPRPDGGLDLLDPLLDRLHQLDAAQVRDLQAWEAGAERPQLSAWLQARLLDEGPAAVAVRQQAWAAKACVRSEPVEVDPVDGPWERARDLPELVASRWREPEAWRRLAEARAAGRALLELPGFLEPEAWRALAEAAEALAFGRLDSEVVHADRRLLEDGELPAWQALSGGETLRALAGAALGRALGPRLTINAWRLHHGDRMEVHPDGPRYDGTFSLGLNADWRAAQGGAIAFGTPSEAGFQVSQRWLPHGGDLLLFAPHALSWHLVEPVRDALRLTVTGWWTTP